MLTVNAFGATHVGAVRDSNEDAFACDTATRLFVVCDGMGGHQAGEVASQLAVETLVRCIARASERGAQAEPDDQTRTAILRRAVELANGAVFHAQQENPHQRGMGATLSAAWIGGRTASIAHVGDSRIYLSRDGQIHQLTEDHSFAEELFRNGLIEDGERQDHPQSHMLTRTIGGSESVKVDTLTIDLVGDDRLMLCSDGLANYLDDEAKLSTTLSLHPKAATTQLIEHALASGGKDNVTVVSVTCRASSTATEEMVEVSERSQRELRALMASALFDGMSLSALVRLQNLARRRMLRVGEVLLAAGAESSSAYVVVKGELARTREQRQVATLGVGKATGLPYLMQTAVSPFGFVATQPCEVLIFDRKPIRVLAQSRPQLGVALYERIARRMAAELRRHHARPAV